MTSSEKVTQYIRKHEKWSDMLQQLRSLLNTTELVEKIKWGAPAYTLNGKIIIGLGAFKNHMGIWFHQGVFLTDTGNQLLNAQEGKTKALRQWRFEKGDSIDSKLVLQYITEAIANSKAGKEVKPAKAKKKVVIPPLLQQEFASNSSFGNAFKKLTPGKQREYAEHIASAKRDATKQSRLQKIIPMVLEGKGLHDKYKNC